MSDNRNGRQDCFWVYTEQLAKVVEEWIEKHRADHPLFVDTGRFRGTDIEQYGASQYLSDHSGLPVRTISRVRRLETKYTSLTIADRLLNAMGREDLIYTDIDVVRNPRWSLEMWYQRMSERGCA